MASLPSAIVFINSDISASLQATIASQLDMTDVITGDEFDARVSADPNYPLIVHLQQLRVLVLRSDYGNMANRYLADAVLFYKQGLIYVLKNNGGPPTKTFPYDRINIFDLLRAVGSSRVVILPDASRPPHACSCGFCVDCHGLGGIFAIESRDTSGIHCPNPDNEMNNEDFINRK